MNKQKNISRPWNAGLSRRRFLAASGSGLAAPFVLTGAAFSQTTELYVRTPGGAYDDIRREVVYAPFEELTGIRVVPVAATAARMLAMFRAGQVDIDVVDTGDDPLLQLDMAGALLPIPYDEFEFTDPDDLIEDYRHSAFVGNFVYAQVLAYNTNVFPEGSEPKSWADFWDAEAFPGRRMLADMASGSPNLEFALIADGVPMSEIYPIDIDRGFEAMSRVRPAITKFWDTGALSTQMLADGEVDMGSIWHTRVSNAIDGGAPLAIQWNEHMKQIQAFGIFKDTPRRDAAVKFVDFCTSPAIQAEFNPRWNAGPVNSRALENFPSDLIVPGTPELDQLGFTLNSRWWAENRQAVSDRWSNWILEG